MKTLEVLELLQAKTTNEIFITGKYVRDILSKGKNLENEVEIIILKYDNTNIRNFLNKYGRTKIVTSFKKGNKAKSNFLSFNSLNDNVKVIIKIRNKHRSLYRVSKKKCILIDSMYLPINYKSKNDLIDPLNVKGSLKNKTLEFNRLTESISKRPILIFEILSTLAETEFLISQNDADTLRRKIGLIKKCGYNDIRTEFNKIILSRKPSVVLQLMNYIGALDIIAVELKDCVGVEQNKKYHKDDVFTHLIKTLDNCDQDLTLRLAALLHDVGKPKSKSSKYDQKLHEYKVTFYKHEVIGCPIAEKFLRRFNYNEEIISNVTNIIRNHMYHYKSFWKDQAVERLVKKTKMSKKYLNKKTISNFPLFKLRIAERKASNRKPTVTKQQVELEKRILEIYNK